jgi:hypothetical protein
MGWTYDELLDLPADVYAVLVEEMNRELSAQQTTTRPLLPDPVSWP